MAIFANGPATTSHSVTTSAGQVFSTSSTALSGVLKNLTVLNNGTVPVYLGGSTVTTEGMPLAVGSQVLLEGPAVNLYAITASGTGNVLVGLATLATVD